MARSAQQQSTTTQSRQTNGSGADLGATVAETGQQVQEQVVTLGQQVRQQATTQLTTQKDRAVDALDTVALLLHQAGEHAHEQDKAMLAHYVDQAAGQLERWTGTLRDQDVTQVAQSTTEFARRQPLLFLGAAAAAGFASVRFLRSTAQAAHQEPETAPAEDVATPGADATDEELSTFDLGQDIPSSLPPDPLADPYLLAQTDQEAGFGSSLDDYENAVLESDELEDDGTGLLDDSASRGTLL